MKFLRHLIVSLLAAGLLLTTGSVYSLGLVSAAQKERSAHSKKPTQFHYVCPMHDNVTSQTRGTCPKCKMKLVRKPVKEPTAGSN